MPSTFPKRTDQLKPGDRVRLPGGAIRTVSHVTDSGYVNRHNRPIRTVHYVEPADGPSVRGTWGSTANTAADATVWETVR